ncbi:MAG: helix-turn-helix domain-containing protein [Holophagales bacterium]|nr:helix-turn-helix domain-containing protein [Holophagales bacterium]
MPPYSLTTPEAQRGQLAGRLRELRLAKGWKQTTLAERSGVSLGSLRRFERSGRISLDHLLRLAFALGRLDDFDALFQPPPARSLAELEKQHETPQRERGRI